MKYEVYEVGTKRKKEYVIGYNEKGKITYLSKYTFGTYNDAEKYIADNKAELDKYVADLEEERKRQREEAEKRKKEKEKKRKARKPKIISFIAGFMAAVMTLVSGHFIAKGISSSVRESKSISTSANDETKDEPEETIIETSVISNDIVSIQTLDEELSTENFEKLVAEFAKPYVDNEINVTTEDIVKFVSIVNIDELAEENSELAAELFSVQTREEYLNDAAKLIGMTYMYNHNMFEEEGNTKNFIKISNSVHGPQKEKMQLVEEYVDRIAAARGNSEEVNKIVSEFLVSLTDPEGELSYLDDGVGFGMQVNIALILNSIARNDLNQENRDWLQTLTSSEKYVSNIFTVYDRCSGAQKTRTLDN